MRGHFRILKSTMPGVEAVMADSRHEFARHTHEQFGIGTMDRGAQRSHSGCGQVEAGRGDAITVNPGEVHDGAPIGDAGRSWRMLYFDPRVIEQSALDISGGRSAGYEFTRPVLGDARVTALLRRLFAAATCGGEAIRHEELLLTLLIAAGEPKVREESLPPPPIARARRRIDCNPAAATTLIELAQECGLSRFQLLRGFIRSTGLTPHAYIIQRRIDLARRLIGQGETLADAAAASGFADQSHMTRAFVARHGVTPGVYAKAMR